MKNQITLKQITMNLRFIVDEYESLGYKDRKTKNLILGYIQNNLKNNLTNNIQNKDIIVRYLKKVIYILSSKKDKISNLEFEDV